MKCLNCIFKLKITFLITCKCHFPALPHRCSFVISAFLEEKMGVRTKIAKNI